MNPEEDQGNGTGRHAEHEQPPIIIGTAPIKEPKTKVYTRKTAQAIKNAIATFLTWQNIFTAIIATATVSQYFISKHLWEVSKQGADAATKAANQARRSADIADATLKDAERSFEVSTRPYVIIYNGKLLHPIRIGQKIQLQAQLRNSGRTPAFQIKGSIDVTLQDAKLAFWPPQNKLSAPVDIPSDVERPITFLGTNPLSPEAFQAITAKTRTLYLYGDYVYSSLTKQYGPMRFCFRYDFESEDTVLSVCEIRAYDQNAKPQPEF